MNLDRSTVKKIRGLLIFAAFLCVVVLYIEKIGPAFTYVVGVLQPFIIGGAVAFVLNIPMSAIEKLLFGKAKSKIILTIKRPISILLAVIFVGAVVYLVVVTVLPQLGKTIVELGNEIPVYFSKIIDRLVVLSASYPEILTQVKSLENIQINWDQILSGIVSFLKSGVGSLLSSTVSVAGNIIGGIIQAVVATIFLIYILTQKEALSNQGKRILEAYASDKVRERVLYILQLMFRNFTNFITGQCIEAVILGAMFVIVLKIFAMPYAVLIGVMIAFLALIPIVGSFLGCVIGSFLILMEDPIKALGFIILFLVLQQIEGNLIYPHVVGGSVGLPSLWVLVAVSVGGSLFGIVGILAFIPLFATGYTLLREDVNARNQRKMLKKMIADSGSTEKVAEVTENQSKINSKDK